jgi:exodeoxyribonuclease-5
MPLDAVAIPNIAASDAAARLRALTDLAATLLVEAGAGSGKTSVLAGRIVMLLAAGRHPSTIAAISFTEASASELRERVERFVEAVLSSKIPPDLIAAFPVGPTGEQLATLLRAKAELDALLCTTIHGFCRALLAPYPLEACLDPGATVADQDAAELIFEEVFDAFLRARLSADADANNPIAATFLADDGNAETLITTLAYTMRKYRSARVDDGLDATTACAELRQRVADFRQFLDQAACTEAETLAIVAALEGLARNLPAQDQSRVTNLLTLVQSSAPVVCRTSSGAFCAYRKKTKWRTAAQARGLSVSAADRLSDQATAHYEACRQAHTTMISLAAGCLLKSLGDEVRQVIEEFQQAKRSAALLDFDDLIHHTRNLLASNPEVRAALGHRFQHVLVDEFQDTDPLQVEILWRLCGDPPVVQPDAPWSAWSLRDGALFMVGDPKQAIYRFRGADVQTYLQARGILLAEHPQNVLSISRNFRSVAPILHWINDRFAAPLDASTGQPGFTPLFSDQEAPDNRLSVCVIDIDVMEGAGADGIRAVEARRIADLCTRLIGAYPVRDRDGALRACRAGDIALLAPTGTNLWRYERALEDLAVPVATQAGKGFFRRQEVHDLIALTRTLADSRDTLGLGALLRGPLVGLTDEVLLDALTSESLDEKGRPPRLYVWMETATIDDLVLRETLEILQALARRARSTTPYVLLAEAVEELRVRPVLRQRGGRSAERALANVDAFLEMSRAYDTRGLRAFARAMRAQWEEETRTQEARPDAEQEAVSLMTMHAAKGLEWPVVIPVNGATCVINPTPPMLDRATGRLYARLLGNSPPGCQGAVDAETQQERLQRQRLWYVTTTRARDLLILPRHSCNLSPNAWINAVPVGLSELPAFDDKSLPSTAASTADPVTNTQERAVFEAESALIAERTPRFRRLTPSRAENGGELIEPTVLPAIEICETAVTEPPQGGWGRGLVLHKLMEEVLTAETANDLAALAARAAELSASCAIDATGNNPAELAATVRRTLSLPEIAELRPRLVPEFGVHAALEDGDGEEVIAGVADAVAIGEDGNVETVIDWKSDVAPTEYVIAGYRQQVQTYLRASGASRGLIVLMTWGIVIPVIAMTVT